MRPGLLIATGLLLAAISAQAQVPGRYTAPDGTFSIGYETPADRTYTLDKAQAEPGHVFVFLKFDPDSGTHGARAERGIVWTQTPDIVTAPDASATGLAESYLADRFPHGGFAITARQSARTADGQLYRVFLAKGLYKDVPARWQGIVLFFPGKGIALISEVYTLNGQALRDQLGLSDAETAAWAAGFRLEK